MPLIEWRCVDAPNDPVEDVIDWVTRGTVAHVEFINVPPQGLTLGARYVGGVAYRPIDYKRFMIDVRFSASVDDVRYAAWLQFVTSQVGKRYAYRSALGILFDHNMPSKDGWFCSDLWIAAMTVAQLVQPLVNVPATLFTPQDALIVSAAMFTRTQ